MFNEGIEKKIFAVGKNPELHGGRTNNKHEHIKEIAKHFGVENFSQIALFDDSPKIVDSSLEIHVRAFQVNGKVGFALNDLLGRAKTGSAGDDEDSEHSDIGEPSGDDEK